MEFWAGDWVPVDPSNLSEVAERHVLVARGRDYADVRPLAGVYSGPAAQSLGRHRRADPAPIGPTGLA